MADDAILIRPAERSDMAALGRLGAALVHLHCAMDAQRFMRAGDRLADGYAQFLGDQLRHTDAVVFVAEQRLPGGEPAIVGYAYAAVEPLSWLELREEAGFIHDLIVDESARGRGVARLLVEASCAWLRDRGMPRVLLHTASPNLPAQRLFTSLGFRPTMVEMTLELPPDRPR